MVTSRHQNDQSSAEGRIQGRVGDNASKWQAALGRGRMKSAIQADMGGRIAKRARRPSAVDSVANDLRLRREAGLSRARSGRDPISRRGRLGGLWVRDRRLTPASNVNVLPRTAPSTSPTPRPDRRAKKATRSDGFDNAGDARRHHRANQRAIDEAWRTRGQVAGTTSATTSGTGKRKLPGELTRPLKKAAAGCGTASVMTCSRTVRPETPHAFSGLSTHAGNGSIIKSIAYKIAKERNVHAVAAAELYQAAERGTLARWINKTDDQIARASKGLIAAPEKGAAKASEVMPPPRQLVSKTLAFESPRFRRILTPSSTTRRARSRASRRTLRRSPTALLPARSGAMSLLSSKLPQQGEPDPLDPHKRVEMTPSEEASFARYAWYAGSPSGSSRRSRAASSRPRGGDRASAHASRLRAAQQETFEALTTQLARGNKLPFRQRELLGQLLDFAATPAQRPQHRAFLQQNVADVLPSNEPPLSAAPAKSRRATTPPSGSDALDRLEAKGPGRR